MTSLMRVLARPSTVNVLLLRRAGFGARGKGSSWQRAIASVVETTGRVVGGDASRPFSTFSARRRFSSQPPRDKTPASLITWKSVGVTAVVGSLLTAWMLYVKNEKMQRIEQERKRSIGKANIGGTFDLFDHNGVRRRSADYLGKWLLIYFGFTHCPDICPDELEKMAKITTIVDEQHPDIELQPLFITVDPERDSPAAIKAYLAEFHPRILGLTGSIEELARTMKGYRVYFSAGPRDQEDDYIVDHTVIMYLVGPDGDFIDYYGQNRTAQQIVDALLLQKMKHDRSKKGGIFGIF